MLRSVVRCLCLVVFAVFGVTAMCQPEAGSASESYAGTLLCADCPGIRTTLTLNRDVKGAPSGYAMSEVYIGRPAAGTLKTNGSWTIVHGDAADKSATVYQLHPAGSTAVTSFLRVSGSQGNELHMLDGSLNELPASVPHTLKLVPAAAFHGGMGGGTANLKVGEVMEVRLDANHTTGYSWVLAPMADSVPASHAVLASEGKVQYLEDSTENKVGVGGVEVWRFRALRAGKELLQFEYRRPWEKTAPAAKTVKFSITVE